MLNCSSTYIYMKKTVLPVLVEVTLEMNIKKIIGDYQEFMIIISLNMIYIKNSFVCDNAGCIFRWWPF